MKRNRHFFFDGYKLDTQLLSNIDNMKTLIDKVNTTFFNNNGNVIIIPYFDGKNKNDGGISGLILGNNSHFTCHTFCYHNTVFIDYYGNIQNHPKIKEIILSIYNTSNYDLCTNNENKKGKFGKHIIIKNDNKLSYNEGAYLIETIIEKIHMTPINDVVENKTNDYSFDLIRPIAESHISIHNHNGSSIIDVFSCKYFDEEKILKQLNCKQYIKINRGIKYK